MENFSLHTGFSNIFSRFRVGKKRENGKQTNKQTESFEYRIALWVRELGFRFMFIFPPWKLQSSVHGHRDSRHIVRVN